MDLMRVSTHAVISMLTDATDRSCSRPLTSYCIKSSSDQEACFEQSRVTMLAEKCELLHSTRHANQESLLSTSRRHSCNITTGLVPRPTRTSGQCEAELASSNCQPQHRTAMLHYAQAAWRNGSPQTRLCCRSARARKTVACAYRRFERMLQALACAKGILNLALWATGMPWQCTLPTLLLSNLVRSPPQWCCTQVPPAGCCTRHIGYCLAALRWRQRLRHLVPDRIPRACAWQGAHARCLSSAAPINQPQ